MQSDAEDRLERRIAQLCRSMDTGFERVHGDMAEVKRDVKALHKEAIPHRVKTLEEWRQGMGGRMWTFMISTGVAAVAAWISVLVG